MATKTRRTQNKRANQKKGGSRRMGEGANFGKGQTRRISGDKVTRKPQVLGMRGRQEPPLGSSVTEQDEENFVREEFGF